MNYEFTTAQLKIPRQLQTNPVKTIKHKRALKMFQLSLKSSFSKLGYVPSWGKTYRKV